jgi:hypothetical protein
MERAATLFFILFPLPAASESLRVESAVWTPIFSNERMSARLKLVSNQIGAQTKLDGSQFGCSGMFESLNVAAEAAIHKAQSMREVHGTYGQVIRVLIGRYPDDAVKCNFFFAKRSLMRENGKAFYTVTLRA